MTNKPLKLRWPYFFGQRIRGQDSSGNMPELIKPESEPEMVESGIEDILRWEDDGGRMLDLRNRTARSNAAAAARKQANE